MSRINYSVSIGTENTARAMGYELHISPKHAVEVCSELRKRPVPEAKKILEDVIDLRRSIPFKKFNGGVGHRSDAPGAGRYPRKAAREILTVLKDAEGNASYKGLSPEKMIIRHIAAKRGRVIKGTMPRAYGRATAKNVETVTVEVILESTEVKKKE